MSTLPKEVLRDMIKEENLKKADDLHSFLKEIFKDTLQEILEADLDIELGYDKRERKNKKTDNRRNGYTPKNLKTKFGEMEIQVPRGRQLLIHP